MLVAVLSSVVVIGGLVAVVVTSKGWPVVQDTFFDVSYGLEVLPDIFEGFVLNLQLAVVAIVCIAVLSLVLALVRTSRAPALAPFRILATVYVDIFRGIPLLLVILLLIGFGVPALQLTEYRPPTSTCSAPRPSCSRYSGVRRRGASARASCRCTRASAPPPASSASRSRRPCATSCCRRRSAGSCRRCSTTSSSLLKDIGLISILGVVDAIRQAQIETSGSFNFTPYVVAAMLFLIVTIPLTRFTDRVLGSRSRGRTRRARHERAEQHAGPRAARRAQELRRRARAARRRPRRAGAHGHRAHRRLRLRQVDAAALRQPARARRRRAGALRRRWTSPTRATTPTTVRQRIGIVFQAFNLFPHMTVLDNITLAMRSRARHRTGRRRGHGARAARPVRPRRQGAAVPRPALRRAAAAGGHRARARRLAAAHALRRGHLGARPRARQRGARGRARPRGPTA